MTARSACWVGALVALLLIPGAHAQLEPTMTIAVAPVTDLLTPDSEYVTTKVTLRISCSAEESRTLPITAQFEAGPAPPYAFVAFDPPKVVYQADPSKCADQNYRREVTTTMRVSTNRDAPAFEVFKAEVQAKLVGDKTHGPVKATVEITNDYVPLTQANPATTSAKVTPGSRFALPIELVNLGNGASIVEFSVQAPSGSALNIETPAARTLDSRIQKPDGNPRAQLEVVGRAPTTGFYDNSIHPFTLVAKSRSPDTRGPLTDETSITYTIQVQGTSTWVLPGLGLFFAALIVGVVFLLRRRRPPESTP